MHQSLFIVLILDFFSYFCLGIRGQLIQGKHNMPLSTNVFPAELWYSEHALEKV